MRTNSPPGCYTHTGTRHHLLHVYWALKQSLYLSLVNHTWAWNSTDLVKQFCSIIDFVFNNEPWTFFAAVFSDVLQTVRTCWHCCTATTSTMSHVTPMISYNLHSTALHVYNSIFIALHARRVWWTQWLTHVWTSAIGLAAKPAIYSPHHQALEDWTNIIHMHQTRPYHTSLQRQASKSITSPSSVGRLDQYNSHAPDQTIPHKFTKTS